jgi:hypothetical protein
MTFASGLDPVYCFGCSCHRRIEPNAALSPRYVIVDRLRDSDNRHAEAGELEGCAERAVTADDHERVEALAHKGCQYGLGAAFVNIRVVEGGAQNRSAGLQEALRIGHRQRCALVFSYAAPAVLEADDFVTVIRATFDDGPDSGIESRAVTPTSE